jgi:predicted extracellular nuclease
MRRSAVIGLALALVLIVGPLAAEATTSPQSLPYEQHWTDTSRIAANDDWSAVPGIVGYLGDDSSTTASGVDPQTVLSEGSGTVDVIANQTNTGITNGGVAEFELADPVVALQGSGTADAPNLVVSVDTTNVDLVKVGYALRDIDGSADDAVQPVALQYRVGAAGNYTNVPAGFVADATTGPSLADQVTLVRAALPADAANKPLVQIRILTTNAGGSDEWVGVDDITVTGTGTPPPPPPPTGGNVTISEVYGGGGNSGATLTNDFVELFNRTTDDISLEGWSVQYASSAGTTWQVTPLHGTIPAGQHYLVAEAAGTGGSVPLPSPNATGSIPMSATSGKVALAASTSALASCTSAAIVDFVGYGAASCSETAPTPALTNTTSAQRKADGAQDTDDNSADFTVGAPTPRAAETAPSVVSTTPAAGATDIARDASVTVTFSEPVAVTGDWYSIVCDGSGVHTATVSGGPTTYTLDPTIDFGNDDRCTVTVRGANVSDTDGDDPPDVMQADRVFSFTTADLFLCGDSATPIHAVQGSEAASQMRGDTVTVEGVVVGDYQLASEFRGFYVQEEDGDVDGNPATSEGIFVFGGDRDVAVGDVVRVRGTVNEFFDLTEIDANAVLKCASGATVTPAEVSLPVSSVDNLERFEGMRIHFDQTLTVTEVFNLARFGEVSLSGVGRLYTPTAVAAPGAAAQAVEAQNQRSRIILDDANNQQNIDPTRYPQGGLAADNTLRVGDTLGGLDGVMDYRFSTYRIQPVGPVSFTHSNPRTAAPEPAGGNLKIASFNVLNYFNGDGLGGGFPTERGAETQFELDRQRAKEVAALSAMNADIVGLMEMENDAGPNSAVADLVRGLNDAMGAGTYSYIDTGVIGGDAIKVALIYKPAKAMPVGDWKIITSAVDPRFDETKNRPSLAQTFLDLTTGEKLTVVVNHLKSKGSDCLPDDPDTGDGSGNCNLTRTRAAAALVDWLKTDPTGSGDSDFLLIGDMNSYTFESPITTFENGGFTNLVRKFGGLAAYSYVFDGESGYLDHALATGSLVGQVTGVAHWHINPDEPTALDYNVNFKTQNQVSTFYAPTPYRSSDHDPVVIGVDFEPTAAGVCTLTQLYVTKPVLVNSLCVKLREGSFGAFENEINAQAGKALTAERAALLARLARTLAGS